MRVNLKIRLDFVDTESSEVEYGKLMIKYCMFDIEVEEDIEVGGCG